MSNKEILNSTGYVTDKSKLRMEFPEDIDETPGVDAAPMSVKHEAPTDPCCPKLDVEQERCTMMNIGARPIQTKAGHPICVRQTDRWGVGKMPCQVPKLLQIESQSEFLRNEKIRNSCIQVLNGTSQQDACPYSVGTQNGPSCRPMTQACLRPDGHLTCAVFQIMSQLKGMIRGPQQQQMVQASYDKEMSDITGQRVSHVTKGLYKRS